MQIGSKLSLQFRLPSSFSIPLPLVNNLCRDPHNAEDVIA